MITKSEYDQLEDDCKKWFNKCNDLSTEKRQLEHKINQLNEIIKELKIDRELKIEFLERFQFYKNESDRLSNLLTDVKSYIIDGAEPYEIVKVIDCGLEG